MSNTWKVGVTVDNSGWPVFRLRDLTDTNPDGDEVQAARRLMEAAPELLKACKILTKAFANMAVSYGLSGDTVLNFPDAGKCQVGDIVACGDTAIAKAEPKG